MQQHGVPVKAAADHFAFCGAIHSMEENDILLPLASSFSLRAK